MACRSIAPYKRYRCPTRRISWLAGVEPAETTDELYVMETYGKSQVMLETEFRDYATVVRDRWPKGKHPRSTQT